MNGQRNNKSRGKLSQRMTWVFVGVVAGFVALMLLALTFVQTSVARTYLLSHASTQAVIAATAVAELVPVGSSEDDAQLLIHDLHEITDDPIAVVDDRGQMVALEGSIPGTALGVAIEQTCAEVTDTQEVSTHWHRPDGFSTAISCARLDRPVGSIDRVAVALPLQAAPRSVARATWLSIALSALLGMLALWLLQRRLRRELEPLEKARALLPSLLSEEMDASIPVIGGSEEIAGILAAMRELRGEAATVRADASEERHRLRRALEEIVRTSNSPMGVSLVEGDRLLLVNDALASLLGGSEERLVGRSPSEFYVSDDRIERLSSILNGSSSQMDFPLRSLDGTIRQIILTGFGIDGDVFGHPGDEILVFSMVDVTSRELKEQSLERTKALYTALVDSAAASIFMLDEHDNIQLVNKAAAQILSADTQLMKGESPRSFVPRQLLSDIRDDHDRLRRGEVDGYRFRALLDLPGRSTKWIDASITALRVRGKYHGCIGVTVNITDQVESERAQRSQRRFLEGLLHVMPSPVFVKDTDGRYTQVNRSMCEFLGLEEDQLVGKRLQDIFSGADLERFKSADEALFDEGGVQVYESTVPTLHGTRVVELHKTTVQDHDGSLSGIVGVLVDVTDRRALQTRLETQLKFQSTLVTAMPNPVYVTDSNGHYRACNEAFAHLARVPLNSIQGLQHQDLWPDEVAERLEDLDETLRHRGGTEDIELNLGGNASSGFFVRVNASALLSEESDVGGVVGVILDISRHIERERELSRLAHRDPLTGIYNRRRFLEKAKTAMNMAHGQPLCAAILDLDHFKDVNDSHGHAVGDTVLTSVAKAIDDATRTSEVVGRIGGEEFGILFAQTDLVGARLAAERIRKAIESLHFAGAPELEVTASLGVARWNGNEPVERLLDRADGALYDAKAAGRNQVRVVVPDS